MSKNPSGAYGPRITLKRVQRTPPSEIQRKVKIARFLYTCDRISCRKEIARQHMSGSNVMSARIGVTNILDSAAQPYNSPGGREWGYRASHLEQFGHTARPYQGHPKNLGALGSPGWIEEWLTQEDPPSQMVYYV